MERTVISLVRELQANEAIPPATIERCQALVAELNRTVLRAARERLRFDDEPSHFQRLIERPG